MSPGGSDRKHRHAVSVLLALRIRLPRGEESMRNLFRSVTALILLAATAPAMSADAPTLKLPSGARPIRYEMTLTVSPGKAKVPGEIAIDVELDRPHDVLWLNADALSVTRANTELPETRVDVLAGHEQFVGFAFEPPLPAGRHRVTLAFEANQSRNSTRG